MNEPTAPNTPITIFGASGFIGAHIAARLKVLRWPCRTILRGDEWRGQALGDVIYCIGLTADFRTRPFDTVEAHVCYLKEVLQDGDWQSFTYLSSTRVYGTQSTLKAHEDATLAAAPTDGGDLYNISKMMGESLTIAAGRRAGKPARVARLSNVYGRDFSSQNFLTSILRDAVERGEVRLQTALDSAKDYVQIDDVVEMLLHVARNGSHPIYNVASGRNTSNRDLMDIICTHTGCRLEVSEDAPAISFPPIDMSRLQREMAIEARDVRAELPQLIELYRTRTGE